MGRGYPKKRGCLLERVYAYILVESDSILVEREHIFAVGGGRGKNEIWDRG